jgi:hypothetical protein
MIKKLILLIFLLPSLCFSGSIQDMHKSVIAKKKSGITITNVREYVTCKGLASAAPIKFLIRPGGTSRLSSETPCGNASYSEIYYDWATNPDTSATWQVAEINASAGGISAGTLSGDTVRVTQIKFVVTFSDLSTQTLYPSSDSYDGDWLNEADGTSLYDHINEHSADDDTSYIYNSTSSNQGRFELDDLP